MVNASVTGVFKMILMIIGVLVLLRFIGQLMIAKRNMEEERNLLRKQRQSDELQKSTQRNFGRTSILSTKKKGGSSESSNVEDVEFEEINGR